MLVRIYPRDPKRGYHAASFQLRGSGYPRFKEERGWYEVDSATAEKLSKYRNRAGDLSSKPVFQICTREEAVAIVEAEQEKIRKADVHNPIPLPKGKESWEEDMGGDPENDVIPANKEKRAQKRATLDAVDFEEDEEDESDLEDPAELDLLGELDKTSGDLTTEDLKPKRTKRASTKKKTRVTKKKTRATKKTPTKKKAKTAKKRRKTSR